MVFYISTQQEGKTKKNIAGWSSSVARRAHNPKVVGSNPAPATITYRLFSTNKRFFLCADIREGKEELSYILCHCYNEAENIGQYGES